MKNMVFILDGCSFHYAHLWGKSGISICWRHLIVIKRVVKFVFSQKLPFLHFPVVIMIRTELRVSGSASRSRKYRSALHCWLNIRRIMVFILDGCSFHYAHIRSKSGIFSCWRHLDTSKESSDPIFSLGKDIFYIIRAHHVLSYNLI